MGGVMDKDALAKAEVRRARRLDSWLRLRSALCMALVWSYILHHFTILWCHAECCPTVNLQGDPGAGSKST